MTIGTVTHPAAGAPADATPDDPRTWDSLSCEELKEIVGRGVQGGDLFYGASRELQRRATLATNAAEEAEATAVHGKQRLTQIVLLVIAVLVMLAAAFEILTR